MYRFQQEGINWQVTNFPQLKFKKIQIKRFKVHQRRGVIFIIKTSKHRCPIRGFATPSIILVIYRTDYSTFFIIESMKTMYCNYSWCQQKNSYIDMECILYGNQQLPILMLSNIATRKEKLHQKTGNLYILTPLVCVFQWYDRCLNLSVKWGQYLP